jgi:DNA-damage-inducible protein D
MKMYDLEEVNYKIFEDIKHIDENDIEYWNARELQVVLTYKEWRNFEDVIDKAKMSCKKSNFNISDNFVDVNKIVKTGVSLKQLEKEKKLQLKK